MMQLSGTGKKYSGQLRCYMLQFPNVAHLETRTNVTLRRVKETISTFAANKQAALVFAPINHLPHKLLNELNAIDDFTKYCKMIAFCGNLSGLRVSSFGLPGYNLSPKSLGRLTLFPCQGFPVTWSVEESKVDLTSPWSFSHDELKRFFGDYSRHQGQMVVLNVTTPRRQIINAAADFTAELAVSAARIEQS